MNRILQPEILDELSPTDPRAIHSRRDLKRINAVMQNARWMKRFIDSHLDVPCVSKTDFTLVELGAGDGTIAVQIVKFLSDFSILGRVVLVDKEPPNCESTTALARELGWSCDVVKADVFDWLEKAPVVNIVIANLFLHHFEEQPLRQLLAAVSEITPLFTASEPSRGRLAPWFARKVWMIGCNDVTCYDAEISVRAGFRENELSTLWPRDEKWTLVEEKAGLFTHFFGAARK